MVIVEVIRRFIMSYTGSAVSEIVFQDHCQDADESKTLQSIPSPARMLLSDDHDDNARQKQHENEQVLQCTFELVTHLSPPALDASNSLF